MKLVNIRSSQKSNVLINARLKSWVNRLKTENPKWTFVHLGLVGVDTKNILAILIIALLWSCSYSFTGSSVPPHLSTIAIPIVKDKSGSGEPNLSNDFTQNLTEQFFDENSLQVVNSINSDAILSVTILSMQERTEVVSGENEKATERRITINTKVVYKDLVLKKTIFDKRISNYATFDASQNFTANRQEGIQVAIDQVVLDILLAVVADW